MREFISPSRSQLSLLPPCIEDWLPEKHLARFVAEVVDGLDLSAIEREYGACGKSAYAPRLLVALLVYGYSTGVFSSRRIEQATYDSVAFRFLAADTHPDHDTIAAFRKRFLPQLQQVFHQILLLAKEMGFVKMGTVSIDGTKVHANASKHKAMSWKYACRLEEQLRKEVRQLFDKAASADSNEQRDDGLDIPAEIALREKRLARIAEAKQAIQHRAVERAQQQQQDYQAALQRREKKRQEGKKPEGVEPRPPSEQPQDKDQYNFTDSESRIMKSQGSYEQAYNAQAAVDTESMLIVATDCTNHANDKNELLPVLNKIDPALGKPQRVLADNGYYSDDAVQQCAADKVEPFVSVGKEAHNRPLEERIAATAANSDIPAHGTAKEQMAAKLNSAKGRAIYALRKQTVEPVFGIIKSVMRFRQFLMRGVRSAAGEWSLVCSAFNLRRMYSLKCAM